MLKATEDFKSAPVIDVDTRIKAIIAEVKDPNGQGGVRRYAWNLGHKFEASDATGLHIDEIIHRLIAGEYTRSPEHWYLCYVADCFSPPFCLVQASSEIEALEIFEDECEDWCRISDVDAKDYVDESTGEVNGDAHYNGNGVLITDQTQFMVCSRVVLIGEVDHGN
jgi:hypothetical protein